ncbi:Cytochrome P450 714C3 [Dichanthelium oligosanthes]|uniref:Cytochrome P450 714C3 n=1 Tax=Dichanthelium oligosanthes TaxID=888268 RepID=A0A1E5VWV8_9POAL|nr:Cytochrome P450 714C3 [Dichanthelium oligosanthes]
MEGNLACVGAIAALALLLCSYIYAAWLSPAATRRRLRQAGFDGPRPSFPFGNLPEITATLAAAANSSKSRALPLLPSPSNNNVDVHAAVFPYFARWRQAFGKVFVYWLGTEPFLYVSDPEFLKAATAGALGKLWGKPDVFRRDRMPMFGRGLVMAEGQEWATHRNIIAPAFSATNLKDMIGVMQQTTAKMLAQWGDAVAAGQSIIDVERGVVQNAAEIIAKASFGIGDDDEAGARVFLKLQAMQAMLFQSNRLVGVPLARLLHVRKTYEAWRLGREIDALLMDIIDARRRRRAQQQQGNSSKDLLSLLLAGSESSAGAERRLTTRELVDECKTFFFGGHETTALALSWTLLMLAAHPEWQEELREEVAREVGGDADAPLDAAALGRLTKMGWVMSEVLRLYPPSPNVQRQALEDVVVAAEGNNNMVVPRGTNMWVDVVAMHRDASLWGEDAQEFRPERFARDPVQGGCRQRMGFLPFGFGGRICVGRNLTAMEYRVVLAMLLRRFKVSVAPEYRHEPRVMLSLRPSAGIHLRLTAL